MNIGINRLSTADMISKLLPLLTLVALPLLLWPSIILLIGLIRQSKGAYIMKTKHIAIFVGLQIVWLVFIYLFSSIVILRPLDIHF